MTSLNHGWFVSSMVVWRTPSRREKILLIVLRMVEASADGKEVDEILGVMLENADSAPA